MARLQRSGRLHQHRTAGAGPLRLLCSLLS